MALEQALKSKDADAKSDVFSLGASLFFWLTGKYPLYTFDFDVDYETLKQSQTFDQSTLAKNMGDLHSFPSDIINIDKKLEAVILKSMEKNREDRYQSAKEFVDDLERYQRGETPKVLADDPDYVEKRRIRQTGAESFVSEKKYREGREAVEKQIADLKSKKADKKLIERYSLALDNYPDRIRPRLAEMKEYMSSCSAEEFVKNIPEFKELIYECKIVPVEKRIGDKFPGLTNENGKWELNEGNDFTNGYWVDMLRTVGINTNGRIDCLTDKEEGYKSVEDLLNYYLIFGNGYDKTGNVKIQEILLKRANELKAQYQKNKEKFIPMWDKDKLDSQGYKLGGTALGIESLMIIEALFNANRHVSDNSYAKIAIKHIDAVIDNLMREDGSAFRYAIFDENGKLIKKAVNGLRHIAGIAKEGEVNPDDFEGYTWAEGQAYLIKGLVDAFKHTKNAKYSHKARDAISLFMKNIAIDKLSYYAINGPKGKDEVKTSDATAVLIPSLIDYADLTGNEKAREFAVKLSQALVKQRLDTNKGYEGLIRGPPNSPDEGSLIKTDYLFVQSLSKLENNVLYEPRNFVSTKAEGKPDWNKSNCQYGFTRLDNAVADEQTEVRVMHDEDNLYFRLKVFGDAKNDFYDIMIGDKRFKVELKNGIGAGKLAFTKLGFYEKPEELKFNIVRNRKDENGKRTTISSWSPNEADLYLEDKKMYFDAKDKLKPEYGTLILK
jgi:hypothetical protein